jgi:hypothetical protein
MKSKRQHEPSRFASPEGGPRGFRRLTLEAGSTTPWVPADGFTVGTDRFPGIRTG